MTAKESTILQPLSRRRRTWFFRLLSLLFLCVVPVIIFYAIGYRVNLTAINDVVGIGGIFITAETADTTIYLNDELVDNYRLFQRAAYIQNLPAGTYQLRVEGEGLHTWSKALPVYPHLVTETLAFNAPRLPQARLIQPYQSAAGTQILLGTTSTTTLAGDVTQRALVTATSSKATRLWFANAEYALVSNLFTSPVTTTSTTTTRLARPIEAKANTALTKTTTPDDAVAATSTRTKARRAVFETATGLAVTWLGKKDNTPYYFCRNHESLPKATTTVRQFGPQPKPEPLKTRGSLTCQERVVIPIDTKTVQWFDFFPGLDDWLLVHLDDGLYALEIDDRGGRNRQLLYQSEQMAVRLSGERIFIHDQGYYFELLTDLAR